MKKRKIIGIFTLLFLLIGTSVLFLGQDGKHQRVINGGQDIVLAALDTDPKVHIDGNWTETAATYDWCTGSGTYEDPYVIKDLIIDASQSGSCILIENTEEYFIIENCTVYNAGGTFWGAGIRLSNVTNGKIINNDYLNNGCGIYFYYSNYNTITGNNCTYNDDGIYFSYSSYNTITGNDCTDNEYAGIELEFSYNNTITRNNCTENYYGIFLYHSNYNTITGNNCTYNYYGIYFYYYSDYNTVIGNNCTYNYYGIYLTHSDYNTVIGNNCTNNDGDGIYLRWSDYNTVIGNNCTYNYCGIYLYYSDYNTITGNNCSGNGYDGIHLSYSNHNTITGNNCTDNNGDDGIYLEFSNGNTVIGNNCTYNYYGIYLYYSDYNTVIRNNCTNNGYDGIYLFVSYNNTIAGNNCTDNDYGIYLYYSDYNTVIGNNCTDNGDYTGNGIELYYSDYNTVIGNNCTNNGGDGIFLEFSYNNTIAGNNCTDNDYGIFLYHSDYNTVIGNNCTNNDDDGIYLIASHNNTIAGNNCTNNYYGIYLYHSDYNTVIGNKCTYNGGDGIYLYCDSNSNTITGNDCIDNENAGIYLSGIYLSPTDYNTITGNNCTNNDGDGIYLRWSDYNTITGNNCTNNGGYGIYLYLSSDNEVTNNFLIKNDYGCIQDSGVNNIIYNNTCILVLSAFFQVNVTEIIEGHPVQFTDNTTGGRLPLTYQWNFGDGSPNSTLQNPIHKYNVAGTYLVVLMVTDTDGDISIYGPIEISVQDAHPVLDSPQDITYEQGTTGHSITWVATDNNPDNYIIYRDGLEFASGNWFSDVPIIINVDGLTLGFYNYTIIAWDLNGNSASDTVFITVEDTTHPVLTTPDDITYEEDSTGYNITWTASDNNPDTYKIYRDGLEFASGYWFSDIPITINVDGLTPGVYNYTIVVSDAFGNTVSDTVIVTVQDTQDANEGDTSLDPGIIMGIILLVSLIGVASIAAIVIFLKRR